MNGIWWPEPIYKALPWGYLAAGGWCEYALASPLAHIPAAAFALAGGLVLMMRSKG
ncbi:hypothetical protein [Thioalbus denitrificans]|uniref:Uncharacterized protein n=1 Tax=Thioalbus denitrificans TaxID=547122 RepID=A0A369CDM6_9GAMM|nr:hypothetical protein [Thioalbus denitrificans]RCX32110.1 hypothetical protein DFQ59_102463 [Thioalbus denitrificans]